MYAQTVERTLTRPRTRTVKPLKCGYDPYTGNWDDWNQSPIKAAAIEFYGISGVTLEST